MTDPQRDVPVRALTLSLAALAVPVAAALLIPGWQQREGVLIWLTSLVPSFLFAYYRGLRGVALSAAVSLALLSVTQIVLLVMGRSAPDWSLLLSVVAIYLAVSIALGLFAEILHRERRAAEALALVDELTGLPNRRHAEVTLDAQFAAGGRGRPLVVMIYDLDNFRDLNDKHGHDAGDSALRALADILRQKTRRMDLSARFGGEEFLSILGDCELGPAVAFANRVRTEIASQRFPWGQLTVSIGVAAYEEGMGSYEVLLASADRALYAAKQGGRNRVEVAELIRGPRTVSYASRRPPVPEVRGGGKGETVLVIDDDLTVRHAIGRMLRHAGYKVEETDDPQFVLRRFGTPPLPDLLVTDVMMPKMNGLTLAGRIAEWEPRLRVIYLSGYLQKDVSWAGLPGAVAAFVAKPVEMQEMLAITRAVLDRVLGAPAVTSTNINPPEPSSARSEVSQ